MSKKRGAKLVHVAVYGWRNHLLARERGHPTNVHQPFEAEYKLLTKSSDGEEEYPALWINELEAMAEIPSGEIEAMIIETEPKVRLEAIRFFEEKEIPSHIYKNLPESLLSIKNHWVTSDVTITSSDADVISKFGKIEQDHYRFAILDPVPFDLANVIDQWQKSVEADVYIASFRGGVLKFKDIAKPTWLITSQFELEGGGHIAPIVDWNDFTTQLTSLRDRISSCIGLVIYSSSAGVAILPPNNAPMHLYVWQLAGPHQVPWYTLGAQTPGSLRVWIAELVRILKKTGPDWEVNCGELCRNGLVAARMRQTIGLQLSGSRLPDKHLEFPGKFIANHRAEALRMWEGDIVSLLPFLDVGDIEHTTLQALVEQWKKRVKEPRWPWHQLRFNKAFIPDPREAASLAVIANQIARYLRRPEGDPPLSLLVLGQPGSGKSYIVEQVALSVVDDPEAVEFLKINVAQLTADSELHAAFDRARSSRLSGRLPIIFLDEFDCQRGPDKFGWLRTFLGPMQDGSYWTNLGERPLGKCIFVFAGGVLTRRELVMLGYDHNGLVHDHSSDATDGCREELEHLKLPDFLSRLRLIHDVPDFDEWTRIKPKLAQAHMTDKDPSILVRAVYSLRRRAILIDSILRSKWKHLDYVEPTILKALLGGVYRNGVRSLEAIIVACDLSDKDQLVRARFPPNSLTQQHCSGGLSFEEDSPRAPGKNGTPRPINSVP